MRTCVRCNDQFKALSRHLNCPSCRKKAYKKPCPLCGQLKQRKSKLCVDCFNKSKQYPFSKARHTSKNGYIYVYFRAHPGSDKEGRVFEHRLIMEKKLGRFLLPSENVHHKNCVRNDNRTENLELWVNAQPSGARVEDVVKWAKDILKLYGDVSSTG